MKANTQKRHNKKQFLTVEDLRVKIDNAIIVEEQKIIIISNDYTIPSHKRRDKKRSPKNNIDRYKWALQILKKLPSELDSNAKNTPNESVNVGDVGETYLKYLLAKKQDIIPSSISTSKQGENDLDRKQKAEIKTVSQYSPANEWNGKTGILAIIQSTKGFKGGVYWVNRGNMRTAFKKGQRVDHKRLRELIVSENIQMGVELGL